MKKALYITGTLLALLASSYGIWMAWDRGLLGNNSRAPIAAMMEPAVRRQALIAQKMEKSVDPCISIDLQHPSPEVTGSPGIALNSIPGSYSVTLLKQVHIRYQPARDKQIETLDFMASQGLFSAEDESIRTDAAPCLARTYRLTWKGFAALQSDSGRTLRFFCGKRGFAGIEKIEKLQEKVLGQEVYEVLYLTRVKDIPEWATTEEAMRLFPKLSQITGETKGKAKVIRTPTGWRSAYEVQLEVTLANRSPTLVDVRTKELVKLERPEPTLEEASQLIAAQAAETSWLARQAIACLGFDLSRGDDDRSVPATRDGAAFAVTYYDRGDRNKYQYQDMARSLHILAALEAAGLAKMKRIKPTAPVMGRAGSPAGLRYEVFPDTTAALELTSRGRGCIPAGRIEIEPLAVHRMPGGSLLVKARGRIEQPPSWVVKIAEQLPALKSIIETGLPLSARLVANSSEGPDRWCLERLMPIYPKIEYHSIPAYLVPLMPLSAAAFHVNSVKAPDMVGRHSVKNSDRYRVKRPSHSLPSAPATSRTTMPVQNFTPPTISKRTDGRAQSRPPYPANNSPVHIISIYQAPLPGGAKGGLRQHSEGVAPVTVNGKEAVLLLFAYEPVEWRIQATRGATIKRIIAAGYYDQRVTLESGGHPEVIVAKTDGLLRQAGLGRRIRVPTRNEANDLVDVASISRALTGSVPHSFQGRYAAPTEGFGVGPASPRFILPKACAPADFDHEPVALHSRFAESVQGNRLLRGPAGPFTQAWADRAYSAGKVYFEGTMAVTGSLAAHVYSNIGLCLAKGSGTEIAPSRQNMVIDHGQQKLYQDDTVFGIAADLDQQKLYYRVNGTWHTGKPGSGNGLPLEAGKMYRPCFCAAGTTSTEVVRGAARSDTTWDVNFGERPFKHEAPTGYVPYQGWAGRP